MSIESWLNRRAAVARLHELERQLERLQQERGLLSGVIAFLRGEPQAASNGNARRLRGDPAKTGSRGLGVAPSPPPGQRAESMTKILVDIMAKGPARKAWTIAELVGAMGRSHPERVKASNASSLVSAALAQALRAKQPAFVSRKRRGKRNNLYRSAKQALRNP